MGCGSRDAEIGLDNRIETLHATMPGWPSPTRWRHRRCGAGAVRGRRPSCQLTYREYLTRLLAAMGIDPLPDEAFSTAEYATDWLDTEESQALLRYQRHSFDDIAEAIAASLGWKRRLASAASPLARAAMLRLSPYYKKTS